jgi:tetraacyldisaccharide 4'-kinase
MHTIERAGLKLVGHTFFRDHYDFSVGELNQIVDRASDVAADAVITTEKDLVRMPLLETRLPVSALRMDLDIRRGRRRLYRRVEEILEVA